MKQLVEMLLSQGNQSNLQDIMGQFGLDQRQAQQAIGSLLPQITQGIQKQAQANNSSILEAISRGNQQRYMDDDNARLYDNEAISEGNGILGQIFGSKETSREVASQASAQTGIDSSVLKQLLPMVASMAMGSLGKQAQAQNLQGGGSDNGLMGMLGSMLDQDGDGSAMDNIMGIASKFFR